MPRPTGKSLGSDPHAIVPVLPAERESVVQEENVIGVAVVLQHL